MNHNIYHVVESKHRICQLCTYIRTFNTQQCGIKQKLKRILHSSLIFVFSTFLLTQAYDGYLSLAYTLTKGAVATFIHGPPFEFESRIVYSRQ